MSEAHEEDQILIAKAQQGDDRALNALIRKHQTRAYQFAYRLTRNPEEAADVVAEAFVRVYRALPNFKLDSLFTTWLFRILTNCFLDMKKKEQRRPTTSLDSTLRTAEGDDVERQFEDPHGTPQDEMERSARGLSIEGAVAMLPEYQRAMIVMYHAENMSYEDIAATLDLPVGTVKSRLNRARLGLRDLLRKDEELFHT